MDFCILGPLAGVDDDGNALTFGGRGDRALLATLLVQAGRIVPVDVLADELWGGAPPANAAGAVQSRVSRLRRALGRAGRVVVTRAPGYLAEVGPGELDAARFEGLAAAGRDALAAGDAVLASERLAAALALWRAPALCDVAITATLAGEAARLEDARLAALEDRIDADLACGRHHALVGELEVLTRTYPVRERMWAHLMLALYRCDRHAEALQAYQRVRTGLGEDLGLEPGPGLVRLERAIVAASPDLDWHGPSPRPAAAASAPAVTPAPAATPAPPAASGPHGGIVTILFTDMVASTRLLERLGDDRAEQVRRTYFGLLRDAVAAHDGHEVKNLGDGLMVVFASAVNGVAAAVEMQQAIARYNRTQEGADGAAFAVRVGLHVGDPIEDEGDYFGTPVVTAARLCDAAAGGQILASTLVEALVADRAGVTCKPAGAVPVRGAAKLVDAVEVLWDAGPQHRVPLPPPLVQAMAPPATPLTGRDTALNRLHAVWAAVRDGGRGVALVSGEPGIGKTRALAELARLVHDDGATVLYGRCDEGLDSPAQPFVQAMQPVADLRPRAERNDPEHARYRLFEAVDQGLSMLTEDAPVLLVLDDLHWADPLSLQLLRHLGRQPGSSRVMVACTYRDVETGPRHPLHAAVADLLENGSVTTVALAGLSPSDLEDLVADLGGAPLDEAGRAAATRLHEMSGGNPTLAREMFTHLVTAGAVDVRDGGWTYESRDLDDALPAGVQELIERRLRRLSEATNRILTLASVVGRDFALDVVEQVSDCPPAAVLEAVEEGVAAKLIAEIHGAFARYRFQHPLVHQTLFRRTSLARRDRLHRRLQEVSERVGTV